MLDTISADLCPGIRDGLLFPWSQHLCYISGKSHGTMKIAKYLLLMGVRAFSHIGNVSNCLYLCICAADGALICLALPNHKREIRAVADRFVVIR